MNTEQRELFLPPDVLGQLRGAQLRPRGLVEGKLAGRFRSPVQGFSVEFAGHRQYVPGDDARHFDWRLYARTRRKYLRQYEQETNFAVQILLDGSESMTYPAADPSAWRDESAGTTKLLHAARIAACLTWLITRRRDTVAVTTFGADAETSTHLPSSSSPSQNDRLIQLLSGMTPRPDSDALSALRDVERRAGRREMIVVISDFVQLGNELPRLLRRFQLGRHRVVLVHLLHPDERDLDFKGPVKFDGYEGMGTLLSDPRELRRAYRTALQRFLAAMKTTAERSGAEYWQLDTGMPIAAQLPRLLAGA